jgi:hypothetical protein
MYASSPRRGTSWSAGLLGLALLTGCGAGRGERPEGASRGAATATRVFEVLRARSFAGEPAPELASARAFDALLHALDPVSACAARRGELEPYRAQLGAALRAGELDFVRLAARTCQGGASSERAIEALGLDALAKAFDARAAFVPSDPRAATGGEAIDAAPSEAQQARGRIVELGDTRVGLVVLPSFYGEERGRSATRDVRFIVASLLQQGAVSVVLDLRGARSGTIGEALQLAGALGCAGPFAQEQRAGQPASVLQAPEEQGAYGGPLAVLVDANTAGVAELFAAALQDRARGPVLGVRTRGEASAQTVVQLRSPQGALVGGLRFVERAWARGEGAAIDGVGVTPDVLAEGDDALFERVRERLRAP